MAKLNKILKSNVPGSKSSHYIKRFYSSRDMSELKHMLAIRNSEIKRGEVPDKANMGISVCGCGNEGCFVIYGYDNR